jgi:hypothetical protein
LRWKKLIGRRQGNAGGKTILDILSYESRAALHRCYSAVWAELLPQLTYKYRLSAESRAFLRLWNCEQRFEIGGDLQSLFHGHVFALHPAAAAFIQSRTGKELVGEAIQDTANGPAYERLLHGLYIAVYQYVNRAEEQRDSRKGVTKRTEAADLDEAIERKNRRARGHRRGKYRNV